MGKADVESKAYMSDNAHFADAVNYYVFGGRQVVSPDALSPLDSTEIAIPYGNGARQPEQKYRDNIKLWKAMMDDEAVYVILGTENQTNVHYAMPVKSGLYDFLNYARQVSEAARTYRRGGNRAKEKQQEQPVQERQPQEKPSEEKQVTSLSSAEYLSGFRKGDKLMPVITLVMYFGNAKWDGPMTIREMLSTQNKEILDLVQDYKIHLVAPANIEDDEFGKFQTDLGRVLQYIKYSDDWEKLEKCINNEGRSHKMDPDSVSLFNAVTGSELKIEVDEEGKVDMCKAIDDMKNMAKNEGKIEGKIETLVKLVKMKMLSLKTAAEVANMTKDEFSLKMKEIS